MVGFCIAIDQLRKTKTAAEAADASARRAVAAVDRLSTAVKLTDIANRCRELLRLMGDKQQHVSTLKPMALELFDVIARYHHPTDSEMNIDPDQWTHTKGNVNETLMRLSLASSTKFGAEDREFCLKAMASVYDYFSGISGKAISMGAIQNATTQ